MTLAHQSWSQTVSYDSRPFILAQDVYHRLRPRIMAPEYPSSVETILHCLITCTMAPGYPSWPQTIHYGLGPSIKDLDHSSCAPDHHPSQVSDHPLKPYTMYYIMALDHPSQTQSIHYGLRPLVITPVITTNRFLDCPIQSKANHDGPRPSTVTPNHHSNSGPIHHASVPTVIASD